MSFATAVNTSFDFREEYFTIFNKSIPTGKCFCVFHDNRNTPAAKVYGNVMHCFVCGRSFTVYDLLKKYNPQRLEEIKGSYLLDKPEDTQYSTSTVIVPKGASASQTMSIIVSTLCRQK